MKGLLLSSLLLLLPPHDTPQYLTPPRIEREPDSIFNSALCKKVLVILVNKRFPFKFEDLELRLNMKGKLFETTKSSQKGDYVFMIIEVDL